MNAGSPPNEINAEARRQEHSMFPLAFAIAGPPRGTRAYLSDPMAHRLLDFFERKGLAALKQEDRDEKWYADWLVYQSRHGLYAELLSPGRLSTRGGAGFDLLRYARFLEMFAYCSPSHGYSLQVSFLGLFAILLGSNEALKKEAVTALEAGELLAFAVSEKDHGSDLLGGEFSVTRLAEGGLVASGKKYYIGNSNAAGMIAVLGREKGGGVAGENRPGREPFALIAVRPRQAAGYRDVEKIRTLGVRAAYVGALEVTDHALPETDVIARGRDAWDAIFGTVTLGKFFLGFGSLGICEHAFQEALAHVQRRILYGKPVLEMPHIRAAMGQAFARITAMKLFAYRALDYVHAASEDDRRYLLYCAVQKARVSVEGTKVMPLLLECVGARGFETDTYFEMALRDVLLIPGLEGSMHINLRLAAQFLPRYFDRCDPAVPNPPSLAGGGAPRVENPYLTEARAGNPRSVAFRPFLEAYRPLAHIPNVAIFARQAAAFRHFMKGVRSAAMADTRVDVALGQCVAAVAYGQLAAENAMLLKVPAAVISTIFSVMIVDFGAIALQLAAIPKFGDASRAKILRMVKVPATSDAEWEFLMQCATSPGAQAGG